MSTAAPTLLEGESLSRPAFLALAAAVIAVFLSFGFTGIEWGLPSEARNALYYTTPAARDAALRMIRDTQAAETRNPPLVPRGLGVPQGGAEGKLEIRNRSTSAQTRDATLALQSKIQDLPAEASAKAGAKSKIEEKGTGTDSSKTPNRSQSPTTRSLYNPVRSYHPDEYYVFKMLSRMRPWRLDVDPEWYVIGGAYVYPLGAALKACELLGLVTLKSDIAWYVEHPDEMARLYLVGRTLSLLLAAGAIVFVMAAADILWGRWAAVVAGLMLALAPLVVQHSHFMYNDVPGMFWVSVAIYASARIFKGGASRHYLLAGIACGLAAGTKLHHAFAIVLVVAMHFLRERPSDAASFGFRAFARTPSSPRREADFALPREALNSPSPQPSPPRGEGEGHPPLAGQACRGLTAPLPSPSLGEPRDKPSGGRGDEEDSAAAGSTPASADGSPSSEAREAAERGASGSGGAYPPGGAPLSDSKDCSSKNGGTDIPVCPRMDRQECLSHHGNVKRLTWSHLAAASSTAGASGSSAAPRLWRVAGTVGVMIMIIILTNPYYLLRPGAVMENFGRHVWSGSSFGFYLKSLAFGFGVIPVALAVAAVAAVGVRRDRAGAAVGLWGVAFYLLLSIFGKQFARYLMPVLPAAAMMCGVLVHGACRRPRRESRESSAELPPGACGTSAELPPTHGGTSGEPPPDHGGTSAEVPPTHGATSAEPPPDHGGTSGEVPQDRRGSSAETARGFSETAAGTAPEPPESRCRIAQIAAVFGVLAALIPLVITDLGMVSAMRRDDQRTSAGREIVRLLPEGSTIAVTEEPWQFEMPPIDARRYRVAVTGYDKSRLAAARPNAFVFSDLQSEAEVNPHPEIPNEAAFWEEVFAEVKAGRWAVLYETPGVNNCPMYWSALGLWKSPPEDLRYVSARIYVLAPMGRGNQ